MMNLQVKILTGLFFMLFRFSIAQSVGGAVSGSTAFCTAQNSGFVSLGGYTGTILFWESSVDNGLNWSHINNSTSSQSYYNINQTTLFRALVKNGAYPADTSSVGQVVIYQRAVGGIIQGGGAYCMNSGVGSLTLVAYTGNIEKWQCSINSGNTWTDNITTSSIMTYSNITSNVSWRAVVSNIAGCPFDTSAEASVHIDNNTVAGSILGTDTVCYGTRNVSLTISGQVGSVMDWQLSLKNSNSWQSLNYVGDSLLIKVTTDVYLYRVAVKNGACPTLTSNPFAIEIYPINQANAGIDITVDQYKPVELNGKGNGSVYWFDGDGKIIGNTLNLTVYPDRSEIYTLMLTDQHSCKTYDSVKVNVVIPLPNAITPNGDGVNDYFIVDRIQNYPGSKFQVFNKWGSLVYAASPYTNSFNGVSTHGTELPDEVYYYVLDLGNGEKPGKNYILIKR